MNQLYIQRLMETHGWTLAQAEDYVANKQQENADNALQCSDFDN